MHFYEGFTCHCRVWWCVTLGGQMREGGIVLAGSLNKQFSFLWPIRFHVFFSSDFPNILQLARLFATYSWFRLRCVHPLSLMLPISPCFTKTSKFLFTTFGIWLWCLSMVLGLMCTHKLRINFAYRQELDTLGFRASTFLLHCRFFFIIVDNCWGDFHPSATVDIASVNCSHCSLGSLFALVGLHVLILCLG